MKKLVLLFAGMLMGLTTATATEITSTLDDNLNITSRYRNAQPIEFVERGVEFIIFPNGEFDFNTETSFNGYGDYSSDDVYYRNINTRRSSVNVQRNAPGTTVRYTNYNEPRGVRIVHDRYGNVRRIGNVFINYDRYGRVARVGSVFIRYRHNRLMQVGGLKFIYNRHGRFIRTTGRVNRQWHTGHSNHDSCFSDFDFYDNDDFYYYKKNGKKLKKQKKYKNKRKKYDDDDRYDD